jgi:hypothetical protein
MRFKTAFPASEWPQTRTFDRAATGVGIKSINCKYISVIYSRFRMVISLYIPVDRFFALNRKKLSNDKTAMGENCFMLLTSYLVHRNQEANGMN